MTTTNDPSMSGARDSQHRGVATGRREAETLILEHLPEISALCRSMFRQSSDAEDATHDAVIDVLKALPTYRGEGPIRHWVVKIAVNAARQHRRRRQKTERREAPLLERDPAGGEMTQSAESRDEQEALRNAISELPDELRESLVLHYFHRLTQVEIAACVGCSQKTVHMRLRKGRELLSRRFGDSAAFGALVAVGGVGTPAFAPAAPELITAVQNTIATHFATTATVATATSLSAAALTAGELAMNMKLVVGATLLAAACLVTGAVVSDQLRDDGPSAEDVAALEAQVEAERQTTQSLRDQMAALQKRSDVRVSSLEQDKTRLQSELKAARASAPESDRSSSGSRAAGTGETIPANATEHTWEDIQKSMAGVVRLLQKMQEEGANQFELGPQMVAELGKLSVEEFEAMTKFDAASDDAQECAEIRAVMLQALIFVPKTAPLRDAYMERLLKRLETDKFGAQFHRGVLSRLAFKMPPFVDAYDKVVAPMNDELKAKFVDAAARRAIDGADDGQRLDAITFLARSPEAKATQQLITVLQRGGNSVRLRVAAAKGLASRADDGTLRALRDLEGSEQDPQVLAAVKQAASSVEKQLAAAK